MKIGLGTVQFGLPYGVANQTGQVSVEDVKEMLGLARAYDIDTLDTAVAYGDSESSLGKAGVAGFKVVTKLPAIPADCVHLAGWVKEQVLESLTRLGLTKIYALLLHRPEQFLGSKGKELYQALQSLKDAGVVQKVGVSIYSPQELDALYSQYRLDIVQAPFNLVDQRMLATGWIHRLKDSGVEIHTRSAFLQGLLLMPQPSIPLKFAQWKNIWHEWHKWLLDQNISALQACLAFPLSFPEIDRVIVGADSVTQLEQIIQAGEHVRSFDFPDLQCNDEDLVNPSRWPSL